MKRRISFIQREMSDKQTRSTAAWVNHGFLYISLPYEGIDGKEKQLDNIEYEKVLCSC